MQLSIRILALMVIVLALVCIGCPQEQKQDQDNATALAPGQGAGGESGSRTDHADDASMPEMDLGWIGDAVDFSCTTYDGGQFRASDSGKPVLINFWAAW